jgi:hypothetical protein
LSRARFTFRSLDSWVWSSIACLVLCAILLILLSHYGG